MSNAFLDYLQSHPHEAPVLASDFDAPLDNGGGYWAMVELPGWAGWEMGVYVDGAGQLAGFKINPTGAHVGRHIAATPAGGLTVRLLRSVRLAELDRVARSVVADVSREAAGGVLADIDVDEHGRQIVDASGEARAAVRRLLDRAKLVDIDIKRTGRKGTPDITYARIAARYVDKLSTEAKPIEALAADLVCSVSQARSQVFKAREKGFLTSRGQGKAGGALTAKAIELLKEETRQ